MNKQGNTYTIAYIIVMVVVVGAALAWVALSLKSKQADNVKIDKMQQILRSVRQPADEDNAIDLYQKLITDTYIVDINGNKLPGEAFDVDVAAEVKKPANERKLPVFVCNIDGSRKYILPVYGAGLWGPIWGYISVESDGNTIYGSYFSHQGETPGLGAEITKDHFSNQFADKHLFKDGEFKSVAVMKKGTKPTNGADYVDAISGGTITSKGVQSMLEGCLSCYSEFLKSLQTVEEN